jgi:hypothetical protein
MFDSSGRFFYLTLKLSKIPQLRVCSRREIMSQSFINNITSEVMTIHNSFVATLDELHNSLSQVTHVRCAPVSSNSFSIKDSQLSLVPLKMPQKRFVYGWVLLAYFAAIKRFLVNLSENVNRGPTWFRGLYADNFSIDGLCLFSRHVERFRTELSKRKCYKGNLGSVDNFLRDAAN